MELTGQSEYQDRSTKREQLLAQGVDPYPAVTGRTHTIAQFLDAFTALTDAKTRVTLTGRLRLIRRHGRGTFCSLEDASGKVQLYVREDAVGVDAYRRLREFTDPGDFLEVSGSAFLTKTGEQSLDVSEFRMIAKSLRGLPSTFHGLSDTETRLRKRYLDLLVHEDVRELFRKKAMFWATARSFFEKREFLEVETPVLERVPGGAEAEPFITHHRALDQDFYLRISLELPLKRLLVGGYERVFEIGRIFRNEGISTEHLQDYTQLEFYWAYASMDDLLRVIPELYRALATAVCGTTVVKHDTVTVDWGKPWQTYDYVEQFMTYVHVDPVRASDAELRSVARNHAIELESYAGRGRMIDHLYKKLVRPHLVEPGFLVRPPVDVEPLAKRVSDDQKRVQRLQVVAWGTELGKGFSELNDPVDQRARFEQQASLRAGGDPEAQQLDDDFVEALEYGMPPAAGFGFSERLFAYLVDRPIRETVLFPPMRAPGR